MDAKKIVAVAGIIGVVALDLYISYKLGQVTGKVSGKAIEAIAKKGGLLA